MADNAVSAVNTEIDKAGEAEFLKHKVEKNEPDLLPIKIVENYKVEKQVDLQSLKERKETVELTLYEFKDDERSKELRPCICYVTKQTLVSIEFEIHYPTPRNLKSAFLACILGYDKGKVEFVEKDDGVPGKSNELTVVIDKKPEFKEGWDQLHLPCRLSSLVKDNNDFKLFNVNLKQSVHNVCIMTVTYVLWNTQIALYGTTEGTKLWSDVGKIDYEPHPEDKCRVVFQTPKFYESFHYYHKRLILLGASYGDEPQSEQPKQ
jgi:hypothetical protein